MFWKLAIKKNRQALLQIVAGLFVLVNWQKGEKPPEFLGPITARRLTRVLLTIEAALRRLIVLYVNTQGVKPSADTMLSAKLPDFASFKRSGSDRAPTFNLFDPRKPLVLCVDEEESRLPSSGHPPQRPSLDELHSSADQRFTNYAALTCAACSVTEGKCHLHQSPSSSGLTRGSMPEPRATFPLSPSYDLCADGRIKSDHDGLSVELPPNTKSLVRRLAALDHAIKTLPQQAKRLARIMAQREHAPTGPKKIGPIRPGIPPGYAQTSNDSSHAVLRECHGLVRDWEKDAWERRSESMSVP